MKVYTHAQYALAGLALLLLTACSQGQVPISPLTKEDAQQIKRGLLNSDRYVIQGIFDPQNPAASSLAAQGVDAQLVDCRSTLDPTNPINQDGDLVPLRLSKTSHCTIRDDRTGAGLRYTGSVTLEDKDDTRARSGFKVSNNTYTLDFFGEGGMDAAPVSSLFYKHNVDLSWNDPNYSIANEFEFSGSSADGRFKLMWNYTSSYVPDNPETPFAAGTLNFQGAVSLETAGPRGANPKRHSLNQNSVNLKYSNTCRQQFVAGNTTYTDGRGNSLVIAYNGCGSVTVTYNGEAL